MRDIFLRDFCQQWCREFLSPIALSVQSFCLPQEGGNTDQSQHTTEHKERIHLDNALKNHETTIHSGYGSSRSSTSCTLVFRYQVSICLLSKSGAAYVRPALARCRPWRDPGCFG